MAYQDRGRHRHFESCKRQLQQKVKLLKSFGGTWNSNQRFVLNRKESDCCSPRVSTKLTMQSELVEGLVGQGRFINKTYWATNFFFPERFFFYIKCNVVVMNWSRRRETESHRKDVVWTRSSVPSSCESVKIFLIKGHLNPKSLVYSHLKAKFRVHKISSQSFEQVISSCKERLLTILFLTYTGILLSHHLL